MSESRIRNSKCENRNAKPISNRAFVADERISNFAFRSSPRSTIAVAVLSLACFSLTATARAAQTGAQKAKAPSKAEAKTAAPAQRLFATPEEAMEALTAAAKAKDKAALDAIYGPGREKLDSGDAVEDDNDLARFAERIEKTASLSKVDDSKFTLLVGEDNWAFPIPIVKQGDKWRFDTVAGAEELLNRRIGENELSAILTCRAYVLAQWEYFTEGDHDKDGVAEYAQKFISTPGHHDGLYWETAEGAKPSPLGALVGQARAEGYSAGRVQNMAGGDSPEKSGAAVQTPRAPYHGYFFKILTRQGGHAPGGKFGYIINGNMIAGYALIAYPDKWGNSGVMTFIVNNQGRVYQKNLGARTAHIAAAISEYDPDPSWKPVKEQ